MRGGERFSTREMEGTTLEQCCIDRVVSFAKLT